MNNHQRLISKIENNLSRYSIFYIVLTYFIFSLLNELCLKMQFRDTYGFAILIIGFTYLMMIFLLRIYSRFLFSKT